MKRITSLARGMSTVATVLFDGYVDTEMEVSRRFSLFASRHVFMSPTDALTSPCTQKLMNVHRYPKRLMRCVTYLRAL